MECEVGCTSSLPSLQITANSAPCPACSEEGIPQESVPKTKFTYSCYEICLCEKNAPQKRSAVPYPQDNREIEYLNRILKPFISYPERKTLENFHPKVPTDFRLAQDAEMPW